MEWLSSVGVPLNTTYCRSSLEPLRWPNRAAPTTETGTLPRPPASAVADNRHVPPDVAFAVIDSPLGDLLLAATDHGLVRLAYVPDGPEPVLADLVDQVSPRLARRPARVAAAARELDEYFSGQRRRFDIRLDWRLTAGFGRAVLEATATIPYGEVGTYGEVARGAGSPGAARAAGGALGANPIAIVIPCHRVVRSGGALGGYGGRPERKRYLLELEGALPAGLDLPAPADPLRSAPIATAPGGSP
jgi:methylated-DNA-[protein]-cysteine S-methyltransferase